MRHLLAVTALLALATCAAAEGIADRLFDPARWETSIVQAVAPQTASGVALSYRVAEYGNFGAWADGGLMVGDIIDPFVGVSTNVPPIDMWLKAALNADMRWGAGYLCREGAAFYYTRLRVELSFLQF